MINKQIYHWNDDPIRPPNADVEIGWAGVPLSQTLGYYGHIKRATLPTNTQLGFVPDYASVDVEKVAKSFIQLFAETVETMDADAVTQLIYEDGYWKDVELLTWDNRTFRGREPIQQMLEDRLPKTRIRNIRINDDVRPSLETIDQDLSFILIHFELDYVHGTGVGVARLSPTGACTGWAAELANASCWKIFTIGTALESVEGWDAETGDKIRNQSPKFEDPLGKGRTYNEIREEEQGDYGFDPTVIIVGSGHCGLTMAARFRVLGIPHLVIEKEDKVGHSWASRYDTLSLHGPTFTNHLPYVPFPHWFPTYLPTKQLAKFLENYACIMDLNVWTNSEVDGKNAVYDEVQGRWTISVMRGDGSNRILRPRHLIIATGISGTKPNIPQISGIGEFEKNGGVVVHSSSYHTDPTWKGKRCVIVGAGTSAHDIAFELSERGCQVTMIQRSATHVMSIEKGVRHFFRSRELTNRKGGLPVELVDQSTFLKQPFAVEYELLPRLMPKVQALDHDLLVSLKKVGYNLHDGYHGGGAFSVVYFNNGGFYYDNGCCALIAEQKIHLVHSEMDHFTNNGVVYKDGTNQEADIVVFATGYLDSKSAIQALMGDKMAEKCHEQWEKGNTFYIGPEGESTINYCPLPQKGLYSIFHQFSQSRFQSARLALRIKAEELGIDVTPYGDKPLGPPNVAAGRRPRPECCKS